MAMFASDTGIVRMLLSHGVNPDILDKNGASPFMTACQFGRIDNLKLWLERFPSHDVHEREKIAGHFAMSFAVYRLPNKLETFEFLLQHGASPDLRTHMGTSVLHAAVRNVDVDLRVVKRVIEESKDATLINYRVTPSKTKWKWLLGICNRMYKMRIMRSAFIEYYAPMIGSTCLHMALFHGDVDLIEMLLDHGADPRIEDGLGRNAFGYLKIYGPFPKVRGLMERATRSLSRFESEASSREEEEDVLEEEEESSKE